MNYPNVSHAKWCFPTSFITSDLDMCPNVSENGLVSVCHRVSRGSFVMCLLVPQSPPFGCEFLCVSQRIGYVFLCVSQRTGYVFLCVSQRTGYVFLCISQRTGYVSEYFSLFSCMCPNMSLTLVQHLSHCASQMFWLVSQRLSLKAMCSAMCSSVLRRQRSWSAFQCFLLSSVPAFLTFPRSSVSYFPAFSTFPAFLRFLLSRVPTFPTFLRSSVSCVSYSQRSWCWFLRLPSFPVWR